MSVFTWAVFTHLAAFVGGCVVWHLYATKVLGYVKNVASKL